MSHWQWPLAGSLPNFQLISRTCASRSDHQLTSIIACYPTNSKLQSSQPHLITRFWWPIRRSKLELLTLQWLRASIWGGHYGLSYRISVSTILAVICYIWFICENRTPNDWHVASNYKMHFQVKLFALLVWSGNKRTPKISRLEKYQVTSRKWDSTWISSGGCCYSVRLAIWSNKFT